MLRGGQLIVISPLNTLDPVDLSLEASSMKTIIQSIFQFYLEPVPLIGRRDLLFLRFDNRVVYEPSSSSQTEPMISRARLELEFYDSSSKTHIHFSMLGWVSSSMYILGTPPQAFTRSLLLKRCTCHSCIQITNASDFLVLQKN